MVYTTQQTGPRGYSDVGDEDVGDRIIMLATFSIKNPPSTSEACHQHKLWSTSVTDIDLATEILTKIA